MKSIITILSLVISASAFADIENASAWITASPLISTAATFGVPYNKIQAETVLNDVQALVQSGELSAYLSQRIKEVRETNADLSESDAVELLVDHAEAILSK